MKLLRVFLLLSAMMVFVACSNESDDYSYTGALPIPQNLAYELIKQQLGDLSSTYKCNFLGADNKQ